MSLYNRGREDELKFPQVFVKFLFNEYFDDEDIYTINA